MIREKESYESESLMIAQNFQVTIKIFSLFIA